MTAIALIREDAAYDAYVMRGRERFRGTFPLGEFDAPIWDTDALAASTATRTQSLYFCRHGSTTDPLPRRYAEAVKSWIVTTGGTASRLHQRLFAARWLWKGIEQRLGATAFTTFAWADLRHADVLAAEHLMLDAELSLGTVNKAATTMADLVRALALAGVAPAITYTPITPRQGDTNNHRVEDPESRGAGVLSQAALAALADIFHRAVTPRDRFYSGQMALMIATGIRWNESVTLPLEPLVIEEVETRDVTGMIVRLPVTFIRRHKAKSKRAGGAGRPNSELQPLTPQQAELARMAVARLVKSCAEARALAARLERDAPRWVWPSAQRPAYLRLVDLVEVLGCSDSNANLLLKEIGEADPDAPMVGRGVIGRVALEAFERHMTGRQEWDVLTVVKSRAGRVGQRASQSLLCVRVNELHQDKATLPLITAPSSAGLDQWLCGDPDHSESLSVFERFENEFGVRYREPDGSPVQISSHMCRRLFVTSGLAAGATVLDMARWQGREHIGDLRSYDYRSMAEKVELVKDAMMTGRLRGQIAQFYVTLADDVRDVWLDGQLPSVHVTPLGICVHDYSGAPCPRFLNCLTGEGCEWYLHDASDTDQVQTLVQLKRRTETTLECAQRDIDAGRVATAWVVEQRTTLGNLNRILAQPAPDIRGLVRPFENGADRFRPFAQGNNDAP